jgi:DNA-binding MarR family transcriptional regulator
VRNDLPDVPASAEPASPEEGAAEIFALLGTLGRRAARHLTQCGGAPELPGVSWMLLHQLRREPGQTVSGLARACGLSKSRISVLADDLAGRGLVEKRPDAGDQRVLRLYLTAAAEGLWRPAAVQEGLTTLVADLDPAERQQLLAALRKMRAGAERRGW